MLDTFFPAIDLGGMAAVRAKACDDFLATRGVSFRHLSDVVSRQVDDLDRLLLTSSPVHGLANATSDIDTICSVTNAVRGERTATQIFDGPNHYETILFGIDEIESDIDAIGAVARRPASDQVLALRQWTKTRPIKLKYLERIINGVAVDGTSPFIRALPDLVRPWTAAATSRCLVAAECARLATLAGSPRMAVGYGLNTVLHAIDATLSRAGQVYSNKKWFLQRWHRFAGTSGQRSPWDKTIDATWGDLSADLAGPTEHSVMTILAPLIDQSRDALVTLEAARWVSNPDLLHLDFLPGATMHGSEAAGLQLCLDAEVETTIPFGADLGPVAARTVLQSVQAGFRRPDFGGRS